MHMSKVNTKHANSLKEVGCYFRHWCFPRIESSLNYGKYGST